MTDGNISLPWSSIIGYRKGEDGLPEIVPEEWDAAQAEIERRKALGRPISCQTPFSTKIKCGDCGAWFGSKVWQSNTKYRHIIWRCNDRYNKRGKRDCKTSHVYEEDVRAKFVKAFNRLMVNRDWLISDCRKAQKLLCDTAAIDAEIAELEKEIEITEGLVRQAIQANARDVIDQSEWTERNGVYLKRHAEATQRLVELDKQKTERLGRSKIIQLFIHKLELNKQVITEFDEGLWAAAIDCVVVQVSGKLTFRFKNGTEIEV